MRNPGGHAQIFNPHAETVANLDRVSKQLICEGVTEFDTFTCGHCNRVIHVPVRQRPEDIGGLCKVCMRLVCPTCVGHACDVIERKLERAERKNTWRRWLDEALGR